MKKKINWLLMATVVLCLVTLTVTASVAAWIYKGQSKDNTITIGDERVHITLNKGNDKYFDNVALAGPGSESEGVHINAIDFAAQYNGMPANGFTVSIKNIFIDGVAYDGAPLNYSYVDIIDGEEVEVAFWGGLYIKIAEWDPIEDSIYGERISLVEGTVIINVPEGKTLGTIELIIGLGENAEYTSFAGKTISFDIVVD